MPPALQFLVLTFAGWVNRHQDDLIAYLREENRVLREHLGPRPLRRTDAQRRRLALVHDSKLTVNDPNPEASHRPILYDSGRPSSVIWFRT